MAVDTANADLLVICEGLVRVTVAGNLKLWARSEVAASTITLRAGSSSSVMKTAD